MTFENKAAKKSLKLRVTCIGLCFSPLLKKEISWWGSRFRAHTVATWPKEETCVFQDQNTRLCFQSYPCIHLFSPSWYWIYFKILNNARGNHTVFMAIQSLHFFFFFFFFWSVLGFVSHFPALKIIWLWTCAFPQLRKPFRADLLICFIQAVLPPLYSHLFHLKYSLTFWQTTNLLASLPEVNYCIWTGPQHAAWEPP